MKKIINKPENFVIEMSEGILKAYPNWLKCINNDLRCIVRSGKKKPGKVGLSTGGGSGHLPLFLGYVGDGMMDGCAIGNVFASPSSSKMLKVTKYIDNGAGVLYIYGNYSGDKINFKMAANMAKSEGIKVEQVIGNDDIASAEKSNKENRRGIAGIFYIYKKNWEIDGECAICIKIENLINEENYSGVWINANLDIINKSVKYTKEYWNDKFNMDKYKSNDWWFCYQTEPYNFTESKWQKKILPSNLQVLIEEYEKKVIILFNNNCEKNIDHIMDSLKSNSYKNILNK